MANTQKKTPAKSSGKSTSAPKKSGVKTEKKPEKAKRPIRREIGGIVCLLLALCVIVGYFQPDGWLIQLLPKLFKGLMGYGFHLVAPALLIAGMILLRHRGRPVAFRVTCALLIPAVWGSLAHLIFCKVDLSSTSGLLPKLWKSGLEMASGGVLSGAVAHGVMAVFGHIASAVIFAVLLVSIVTVISHRLIGKLWSRWRERERYEEEEDEDPPVVVPEKKPEAKVEKKTPRSVIDIPLDEEEGPKQEKRPGVLSGFFRQKSKDQKTPDEVLRDDPKGKKSGDDVTLDSPFVEDMAGFLSLLDVQLNCSTQSEACSMSIIEGMSLGLPTIASRCSGNPWLVEDSITGLLFENKDAEALTKALAALMDAPVRATEMGTAARKSYETRFTGEIFAANLEQVYDDILKKKGGSSR